MMTPVEPGTYQPKDTKNLRDWFFNNQDKKSAWIVIFKKSSNRQVISFDQVIEEAICHGWIDSRTKNIDEDCYAIYLTPRKPGSHWTTTNQQIAQRMMANNRMTKAAMDIFAQSK